MEQKEKVELVKTTKPMTVAQATALILGTGVGGGIMSLPYFVSKVGVPLAILIMLIALTITCFLSMMFADLAIRNGKIGQVTDIIRNLVLKGKLKTPGTILLFILISLQLIMCLGAYISGAGQILNQVFGLNNDNSIFGKLTFFIVAGALIFFSLKILGVVEQVSTYIMFASLFALVIGSIINANNALPIKVTGGAKGVFAFYGITMLAFNCFHCIPHVVEGLEGDHRKIHKSIVFGSSLNFLLVLTVAIFSLLSCKEVTTNIIIGWSAGVGNWAKVVGSIFSLLAFLTSFWALSCALRDIVVQSFNLKKPTLGLIISVIPSLIIALLPLPNSSAFSNFISLTSALNALIIAIFVIPAFYYQRKIHNKESTLGVLGSTPICVITLIGYLLMCAGSIVSLFVK